jgi:hypothetical protein
VDDFIERPEQLADCRVAASFVEVADVQSLVNQVADDARYGSVFGGELGNFTVSILRESSPATLSC